MFDNMLKDRLTLIKPDGSIAAEQIPALVMRAKIQIHDTSIPMEVSDHLLRSLPNGLVEDYVVDDPVFETGLGMSFYTVHVHRSQSSALQQRVAIQNITNNFHGANSRVNIATTDYSKNVSLGLDLENVQAFLEQLKLVVSGLPEALQTEIKSQLGILEGEVLSSSPSSSKIRSALQAIRTIAEGATGNLIASGIVGMLASMH